MLASRIGWTCWAMLPIAGLAYHYGPGQRAYTEDRARDVIAQAQNLETSAQQAQEAAYQSHLDSLKARNAALASKTPEDATAARVATDKEDEAYRVAAEAWKATADKLQQAQDMLAGCASTKTNPVRVARDRALIRAGKISEGVGDLENLLETLADNGQQESALARSAREEVATGYYYGARLMRMAGKPAADWRAVDVDLTAAGSRFVIVGPDGTRVEAGCPLPGDFNVANTLAAVAACAEAGFDAAAVAAGIAAGGGVPGRLERVEAGQPFTVVVDYAHKPDAVEAAIRTLRPLTSGRVIVVLGAGGDRDAGKRPLMGEIAARAADLLVVTDDNPRTEDPAAIRREVLAGAAGAGETVEIGDRRAAIRHALGIAAPGDVVLIAGKGHESGQEVDGVVYPFDDRVVAHEELSA